MKRPCQLCKNPREQDSILCVEHRARAQAFSSSFLGVAEAAHERDIGRKKQRDLARVITQSIVRTDQQPNPEPHSDRACLQALIASLYDSMVDAVHSKGNIEANRWPQISLYYVRHRLQGRSFYTIIPVAPSDTEEAPLCIDSGRIRAALEPDSEVLEELIASFLERMDVLRSGELKTVSLLMEVHKRRFRITEQGTDNSHTVLATYSFEHKRLKRVSSILQ